MGTRTCLCLVWNSKFHSPDPGWSNTRRGLLLNIPSRKSGLEVIVVITMHCFKILRSWGPDRISGVCDMLRVVSIMHFLYFMSIILSLGIIFSFAPSLCKLMIQDGGRSLIAWINYRSLTQTTSALQAKSHSFRLKEKSKLPSGNFGWMDRDPDSKFNSLIVGSSRGFRIFHQCFTALAWNLQSDSLSEFPLSINFETVTGASLMHVTQRWNE